MTMNHLSACIEIEKVVSLMGWIKEGEERIKEEKGGKEGGKEGRKEGRKTSE